MVSKLYDITVPISPGMLAWPGDPKLEISQVSAIAQGAESNVSQLRMSVHTGTHIDAPKHFLDGGKTIDQINLQKLIGPAFVMVISDEVSVITKETLTEHPAFPALAKVRKVLFRTRNSVFWPNGPNEFQQEYVGFDPAAAQLLADLGMDLVGVDYLSVASYNDTDIPHKILLEKEVVLLEGIDLTKVPEGYYELYCLPLLLSGCDGSPARVILKSDISS